MISGADIYNVIGIEVDLFNNTVSGKAGTKYDELLFLLWAHFAGLYKNRENGS